MNKVYAFITLVLLIALLQIYEFAAERKFQQYSLLKNKWVANLINKIHSRTSESAKVPVEGEHFRADQRGHVDLVESKSTPPPAHQRKPEPKAQPPKAKVEPKPAPSGEAKEAEHRIPGHYPAASE